MYANIINKTIEMSKNEAKAAGKVNSQAFKDFQQLHAAYPNYEIEIKASTKRNNDYKGLTYDYMRSYIENHGGESKEAIIKEFNTLTNNEASKDIAYFDVRDWFLEKFKEVKTSKKERKEKVNAILNKAA